MSKQVPFFLESPTHTHTHTHAFFLSYSIFTHTPTMAQHMDAEDVLELQARLKTLIDMQEESRKARAEADKQYRTLGKKITQLNKQFAGVRDEEDEAFENKKKTKGGSQKKKAASHKRKKPVVKSKPFVTEEAEEGEEEEEDQYEDEEEEQEEEDDNEGSQAEEAEEGEEEEEQEDEEPAYMKPPATPKPSAPRDSFGKPAAKASVSTTPGAVDTIIVKKAGKPVMMTKKSLVF